MKIYILRFLRALKWFLMGIFTIIGTLGILTTAFVGGEFYEGRLVRRKEGGPKGSFEHLKTRYSDSNENENVELGFH